MKKSVLCTRHRPEFVESQFGSRRWNHQRGAAFDVDAVLPLFADDGEWLAGRQDSDGRLLGTL